MSGVIERQSLVQTLVDEASDVDLVCYLVRSGGEAALKDLLECIRDAECLTINDLLYNIGIVRQKKSEASVWPMRHAFQRLMRSDVIPAISAMQNEVQFTPAAKLH
jgi:hypothetical protein